eukprot:5933458-Pyramimonas_sp.AAC.2
MKMRGASIAFVLFFAFLFVSPVLAGQVGLTYYEKGGGCSSSSQASETDPIGSCANDGNPDQSTFATKSGNTVTFKIYANTNCNGSPTRTFDCDCQQCCELNSVDYDDDVKVDCSEADDPVSAAAIELSYYEDSNCNNRVLTDTDQVGVCEKESSNDWWHFVTLAGGTAQLSMYSAAGCESGNRMQQFTCGCSDACCEATVDSETIHYSV